LPLQHTKMVRVTPQFLSRRRDVNFRHSEKSSYTSIMVCAKAADNIRPA
jgi:hypothetical protein